MARPCSHFSKVLSLIRSGACKQRSRTPHPFPSQLLTLEPVTRNSFNTFPPHSNANKKVMGTAFSFVYDVFFVSLNPIAKNNKAAIPTNGLTKRVMLSTSAR